MKLIAHLRCGLPTATASRNYGDQPKDHGAQDAPSTTRPLQACHIFETTRIPVMFPDLEILIARCRTVGEPTATKPAMCEKDAKTRRGGNEPEIFT
jgi:hypothetical protein